MGTGPGDADESEDEETPVLKAPLLCPHLKDLGPFHEGTGPTQESVPT